MNMNLLMLLTRCGMVSLLLAACSGGDGTGDASFSNPEQAQSAAAVAATTAIFSGGLREAVAPVVDVSAGKRILIKSLGANFRATQMPQTAVLEKALRRTSTKSRAMTDNLAKAAMYLCGAEGTFTNDNTHDPLTGNKTDETIYSGCNDDDEGYLNGRVAYRKVFNADRSIYTETWITGDGDSTLEPSDLTFSSADGSLVTMSGTFTYAMALSSGTFPFDSDPQIYELHYSATTAENSMVSYEDNYIDMTFAVGLNTSGVGNQTIKSTYIYSQQEVSTLDGSMALVGVIGDQDLKFAVNMDHTTNTWSYDDPTQTSTDAPSGTLSIDMLPSCCIDGTFTLQTIVPIKRSYDWFEDVTETVAGEVTINDNTTVIYASPDIVTISRDSEPFFTAHLTTLNNIMADSCPLYRLF